jgi:hypothetical protein
MGGMKQPDDYSPAIDACTHVRNRAALVFVLAFLSVMVFATHLPGGIVGGLLALLILVAVTTSGIVLIGAIIVRGFIARKLRLNRTKNNPPSAH